MAQTDQDKNRDTKNLLDFAKTTTQDLYALLSLPSPIISDPQAPTDPTSIDASAIRKAYRKAALVHHPDKNPNNASAAAKFDEINKAYEILINPEARHVYDERQRALREKAERHKAFEGKRKRMKEDLERRESAGRRSSSDVFASDTPTTPAESPSGRGGMNGAGFKRRFPGSPGVTSDYTPRVSEEKEAELRRLAAEGARRRMEHQEKVRKRREEPVSETSAQKHEDAVNSSDDQVSDSALPRSGRSFKFSSPSAATKVGVGTGSGGSSISGAGKGSSLFQSTMARLKEAEKKRQEEAALREERPAADAVS